MQLYAHFGHSAILTGNKSVGNLETECFPKHSSYTLAIVQTDTYSKTMDTTTDRADNSADVEIARRITNALIVRGIDKKALAQQVGLSYSTLRRSLDQDRGDRRSLSFRELGKIAEALDVQPFALLPDSLTKIAA